MVWKAQGGGGAESPILLLEADQVAFGPKGELLDPLACVYLTLTNEITVLRLLNASG